MPQLFMLHALVWVYSIGIPIGLFELSMVLRLKRPPLIKN
jgi:hypothetical protein